MKKALIYIGSFSILVAIILVSCEPLDIKRVTKINTGNAEELTYSSITMKGMIIDASDDLVEVGHCWSENPSPDYFGNHAESVNGLNPGEWIYTEITNLRTDQDYFIRAYANLGNDNIIYGDEIVIHTAPIPSDWYISVTSPTSDGQVVFWPIGKEKLIEWSSNVRDTFIVELFDNLINTKLDDIAIVPFKENETNYSVAYIFSNDLSSGDYAIRVQSAHYDKYDIGTFRATNPSIYSITSPVAGDQWNRGREYSIGWSSQDVNNIDITLYSGSTAVNNIATEISNNDTYPWEIPNGINPGNDYRIVVSYHDYPEYADTSDVFEILSEAYINITEPNSSSTVTAGTTFTITWDDNIEENVKIVLYKDGSYYTLSSNTESDGSFDWTPTSSSSSATCTITISSVDDYSIVKTSETFNIN